MQAARNHGPYLRAGRVLLAALLLAIALPCVVMGVFLPFDLAAQARTDRLYYAQFQQAAAYVERTGHLPDRAPPGTPEGQSIYPLSMPGWDCPSDFEKAASDRFVLSFWRGEWAECYAFPSGRTTLSLSALAYLRGSPGQMLALLWLVALGAFWGAARLFRGASRISAA